MAPFEVVFIYLTISQEMQEDRLAVRHGKADAHIVRLLKNTYSEYLNAKDQGEDNAYEIPVVKDMSREEVAEKVYQLAQNID